MDDSITNYEWGGAMENKISENVGRNLINCRLSILIFNRILFKKWFSQDIHNKILLSK
jgi:hypothetical protein